jgi:hypothetical protein
MTKILETEWQQFRKVYPTEGCCVRGGDGIDFKNTSVFLSIKQKPGRGGTRAGFRIHGPGYWTAETSGVLRPAVEAYLSGLPMSAPQIATMRAYCRQWINAPVWDDNPHAGDAERQQLAMLRRLAEVIASRETLSAWLAAASDAGMDPL